MVNRHSNSKLILKEKATKLKVDDINNRTTASLSKILGSSMNKFNSRISFNVTKKEKAKEHNNADI